MGGRVDSDQILAQLRHRKWAVGIATTLETQTIHMTVWDVCDKRMLGVAAREGCV